MDSYLIVCLHGIRQITPVVTEGNEAYVHHMVIYECYGLNDTHVGQSGVCIGEISNSIQQCRAGTTLAGWAVGGGVSKFHHFVRNETLFSFSEHCVS